MVAVPVRETMVTEVAFCTLMTNGAVPSGEGLG